MPGDLSKEQLGSEQAVPATSEGSERAVKPGVYIRTFGCQMNEYDTQKLYKILERDYTPVETPEQASLVLINTCSVRDKPEQKLYSMLGQMRALKTDNSDLLIGVCGCVAQQEGENIVKRDKGVDFVFGTHNLSLVPSLIQLRKKGAPPQVAVDYRDEWEELPLGFAERDLTRNGQKQNITAFIAISRGCNKNCTYCIVPTTRGPEVSRGTQEILREVKMAAHRGTREVVLLGQTVNSYGLDLSPRVTFVDLLRQVAAIEGIERIRFTSPHPQEIRRDFVEFVTTEPKICRHVHMPLQSGSDRVLKAMNRNYRRKRYLEIIDDLKARVPDMAVTTDIIVGFPGETEEDFEQTMSVMEHVQFDNSYSFIFSPRPGTVAAEMVESLTPEVKLSRLLRLQARQEEIMARRLAGWVGKEVDVLLDSRNLHLEGCLSGRTSQNFVINLDKPAPEGAFGSVRQVRVTGQHRFTLIGEAVT